MELKRRELLRALFGAPAIGGLACNLDVCDEGEAPAGPIDGELLGQSMGRGHRLRDEPLPSFGDFDGVDEERVGVAILGAGPAGLSAGWRLTRRGVSDVAIFELEPVPGGTSRSGRSEVTAYPWAAHYLPVPMAHHEELVALLDEMDAFEGRDDDGNPIGAERLLVRVPEERIFTGGYWYEGLFPFAGASPEELAEHRRFKTLVDEHAARRDGQGRRAFAIPAARGSDDPDVMALDRISAADWLDRQGFVTPRMRWFLEYACRDDYGLTLSTTSAWALLFYYAARTPRPGADTMDLLAWPEGNGALVDHLAAAGPRVETGAMVVDVEPREDGVVVRIAAEDRLRRIRADRVVCALPRFVARRVVRPLRERRGDEGFTYGAWLVSNLHLSERPAERGFPMAWDNVLFDSPSLGYVCATHQRGRDYGPTVLTYYLPYTDDDPAVGRRRMLELDHQTAAAAVVADLSRAHPDLQSCLTRLDVFRWGHAMIQPRVGFVSSAARRAAAEPVGGVHFAHSDLSGLALFEEAFHHGVRAADEVVEALSPSSDAEIAT